jgi:signal transduction histidine kinase
VNNIIKHADAGKVVIHLHADEIYIHLTISDNGKGFDITTQRKGVGITNIISRVELFNGKVEIQSAPGKGCNLDVQIPLV